MRTPLLNISILLDSAVNLKSRIEKTVDSDLIRSAAEDFMNVAVAFVGSVRPSTNEPKRELAEEDFIVPLDDLIQRMESPPPESEEKKMERVSFIILEAKDLLGMLHRKYRPKI